MTRPVIGERGVQIGTASFDASGDLCVSLDALPVRGRLTIPGVGVPQSDAALRDAIARVQVEHGREAGISLHVGQSGAWSCWSMRDATPGEPGSEIVDRIGTGDTLDKALVDLLTGDASPVEPEEETECAAASSDETVARLRVLLATAHAALARSLGLSEAEASTRSVDDLAAEVCHGR